MQAKVFTLMNAPVHSQYNDTSPSLADSCTRDLPWITRNTSFKIIVTVQINCILPSDMDNKES